MTKKTTPSKQQRLILDFVRDRGAPDLDEILDFTEAASKASLQFTIRAMVTKGLISKLGTELRRGRARQTFGLAPGGRSFYDPRPAPAPVSVSHPEIRVSDFPEVVSDFPAAVSDLLKKEASSVSDFTVPEVFYEE